MIASRTVPDEASFKATFTLRGERAAVRSRAILRDVGVDFIMFLRSYTRQMAPPYRAGGPFRPRHPGFWADRTGDLVRAHYYKVHHVPKGGTLEVGVDERIAPYARHLDRRDGYSVLTAFVGRNRTLGKIIRRGVKTHAPDWRFTWTAGS